MKYRKFFIGLTLHVLLSGILFSAAIVYQKGYNTTHRETVRMANITLQEQSADVQILHYHLPFSVPSDNSILYYAAYLLTDTPLHEWTAISDFIKNS